MTEDQAKKLWCPHVRVSFGGNPANRIGSDAHRSAGATSDPGMYQCKERDACCIGSACMAWRMTAPTATVRSKHDTAQAPFLTSTPEAYEAVPHGWIVERCPREGFCGLAGVPL